MARIYSRKDRVAIRIGDIKIKIAPLTAEQKQEVMGLAYRGGTQKIFDLLHESARKAIKYSVRSVEGVKDSNDEDYKLQFDPNGDLSDECVSDLLNLECNAQLTQICSALTSGIPDQFTDSDGKRLEGVEIIKTSSAGNV